MKRLLYYWIAFSWAIAAVVYGYGFYRVGKPSYAASVVLYIGLTLVFVGYARKIQKRHQMEPESIEAQIGVRCQHFTGLMHDQCAAGVVYESVRDTTRRGLRCWPCFRDDGAAQTCALVRFPTPAEIAEEAAAVKAAARQFFIDMMNGTCPHCKQPYTPRQVGRSVYAEPCGHRLYQGKAAAFEQDTP